MSTLMVSPLEWSALKDIDDVKPLNEDDTDCLVELRDVLRKHDKLKRFGVALLHSHFDLEADEIMLESTNEETRTLITKPIKLSEAGINNVGTVWMLQEGSPTTLAWCRKYCEQTAFRHREKHNRVAGD